jgi:hypothetical protein
MIVMLDQEDLNNSSGFVRLAFEIITNEVLRYKFLMAGGKRK